MDLDDAEIDEIIQEYIKEGLQKYYYKYLGVDNFDESEAFSIVQNTIHKSIINYKITSGMSLRSFIAVKIRYRLLDYLRSIGVRTSSIGNNGELPRSAEEKGLHLTKVNLDAKIDEYSDKNIAESVACSNTKTPIETIINEEFILDIHDLINRAKLDDNEYMVIDLYWFDDLKLYQIAKLLGVTESRICQINQKALKKLREKYKLILCLKEYPEIQKNSQNI